MGVIYKATNKINGHSYIGQTTNFQRRKMEHLSCKCASVFAKALKKYGKENFIWEILEECNNNELDEREIYWISYYNTYYNGYNSTQGGQFNDGLLQWQKTHKDIMKENALNGLKYAEQYWEDKEDERIRIIKERQKQAVLVVMRKVKCVELNKIFNSLSEAEKWSKTKDNPNGLVSHHQHISKVCSGKRHTTGGYHWEYV